MMHGPDTQPWLRQPLGDIGIEVRDAVRPLPGVTYELFSVPAFATGRPERVDGGSVGSSKRVVQSGDVLLCKINPRINRVWLVPEAVEGLPQIASTEYLTLRLREPDASLARWLMWYLRSPRFRQWIEVNVEGATGSHTRAKSPAILQQPVPVPRRQEREALVAAIEQQMSGIGGGQAVLGSARARLHGHRSSLLARAFDGHPTQSLADVCSVIADCEHRTPAYGTGDIPALRPRDVVGGILDLPNAGRVGDEEYKRQTRRHVPAHGDVAYSRELSYGWAAELPDEKLCLGQGMVVLRPGPDVSARWLVQYLNSREGRDQAKAAATGTAHPHINLGAIRSYRVPAPNRSVQGDVLNDLSQQLSLIDRLSADLDVADARAQKLGEALLAKAFV